MKGINWDRLIEWGFRGSGTTEEEEIALGAKMKELLEFHYQRLSKMPPKVTKRIRKWMIDK